MTSILNTYITMTKANSGTVLDWLQSHEEVRGWPKSIGTRVGEALASKGQAIHATIDGHGTLGYTYKVPADKRKLSVGIQMVPTIVDIHVETRETVEFGGKTYFKDDLERALANLPGVE